MTKLYRPLLVFIVLILIVLGLNTSNQGTNSLTAESRKPVLGFHIEKQNINIFALGEQYTYSKQEICQESSGAIQDVKTVFNALVNYLKKIWTIFRVLFLE